MKLQAINYTSPIETEGQFTNVFIEETSVQLKRQENYLKIDFEMYYMRNEKKVILAQNFIAFQGMDNDPVNTNRKATFKFNSDTEEQEPRGLIDYLMANAGEYPTNFKMIDWGYPTYEQALNFLTGGNFDNPEVQPINDFVRSWILNTVIMKNEAIGAQFQFVE